MRTFLFSTGLFLLTCNTSTNTAEPCTNFGNAGIFSGVFMSIIAVCSLCVLSPHVFSTKYINLCANSLKMIWVNAKRITAKMVQYKLIGGL